MKKIIKKLFLFLTIAFVLIQFFRPEKNKNTDPSAIAKDITTVYTVPDSVKNILKSSCYDCHSNNTDYPWYSNIQPVTWWQNNHIKEGKS